MGLYSDLTAWGLIGGGVHHLARGIQGQPLRFRPLGYMLSALSFIGFGLVMDNVRKNQLVFRERRLEALIQAREERGLKFTRPVQA